MLSKIILFLLLACLNTAIYIIFNHKIEYPKRKIIKLALIACLIWGIILIFKEYVSYSGFEIRWLLYQSFSLVILNLLMPILTRALKSLLEGIDNKVDITILVKVVDFLRLKILIPGTTISQFVNIFFL